VTFTTASGGTWYVKVRNIEVGEGGPYTLELVCQAATEPTPPPSPYALFIEPSRLVLGRSASGVFHVTGVVNAMFSSDVRVSVVNLPPGVTAAPASFMFSSPGSGRATVAVNTDDTVASGDYSFNVVGVASSGLVTTASAQLIIVAPCTPASIRNQPSDVTRRVGQAARLSVQPSGTGPITYQWYRGFSPNPRSPISGATFPDYETEPFADTTEYWVRLTNACGSRDSATVTVTITRGSSRRRSARH
jgi:hypothetical protein